MNRDTLSLRELCFILTFFLGAGNFIAGAMGLVDSTRAPCRYSFTRIELLFPGYRIGCWLGEPLFGGKENE